MSPFNRLAFRHGAAVVPPVLLACALFWALPPALEFWWEPWRDLAEQQRVGEEYSATMEAFRCQREEKRRVLAEVKAGRLTLLEAAARFRELDRQAPWFNWDAFRRCPGASDDERHCREVIILLGALLPPCPEGENAARRLEAELQEHVNRGTLRLPTGGATPP